MFMHGHTFIALFLSFYYATIFSVMEIFLQCTSKLPMFSRGEQVRVSLTSNIFYSDNQAISNQWSLDIDETSLECTS